MCYTHLPIGWHGGYCTFRHPLDYLGAEGGAGVGSGPGITVGAALALKGSGRLPIGLLGDGDFLMSNTAIWTAVHYQVPCLMIVCNNRSFFNDELHQERVAIARGRPPENRWIGQRIGDPDIDLAAMARAQGATGIGPVNDRVRNTAGDRKRNRSGESGRRLPDRCAGAAGVRRGVTLLPVAGAPRRSRCALTMRHRLAHPFPDARQQRGRSPWNARYLIGAALLVTGLTVFGCATTGGGGWITLIDGEKGLENFNSVGDANWRAEGGAIVADKGKGGYLVSKNSYANFEIRAEFWAAHEANSGIFMRCADSSKITDRTCYEANIFDQRPDPTFGTGALQHLVRASPMLKAGGRMEHLRDYRQRHAPAPCAERRGNCHGL